MEDKAEGKKISGAAAARIVVIVLIGVFLSISAITMLRPAPTAAPARPGGNGAPGSNAAARPGAAGTNAAGTNAAAPSGSARPAGGTASGTNAAAPSGNTRSAASNAITVSTKIIQDEVIRQIVKLNGDVASQSEVTVQPETSGRVTRILKKLGDKVRAGEIICYIDPSKAGASYAENPVRAGASGTITALNITPGNMVSTSSSIATLGSLDDLKITIYVAEKYSAYLRKGLPAFVTLSATAGEELRAEVSSVSPVVNNKNRTIETTLILQDKDPRIKAGMFAAVRLVIREEDQAMVVPRTAVKDYNGSDVVYLVQDGLAARRAVKTGLSNDTDVQISEGLSPGDEVIIAGSVTDGSPVRVAGK